MVKHGESTLRNHYFQGTIKCDVKEYELESCGKYGFYEKYPDGSVKYSPVFCNLRYACLDCWARSRNACRITIRDRIMAVIKAHNVSELTNPVYTLVPEIRSHLEGLDPDEKAPLINELSALVADSYKQLMGIHKARNSDDTGFVIVIHPHGDKDPFAPFLHFTIIGVPLKISKDGKVQSMGHWFHPAKARRLWFEAQKRFCTKHGLLLRSKETDIKLSYVPVADSRKLGHMFRYAFRPLTHDVLQSIVFTTKDLDRFIWVSKKDPSHTPHLTTWAKLTQALDRSLNFPCKLVRSYGFMHNLKKHSAPLGLELVPGPPVVKPLDSVPCEFKRSWRKVYNKKTQRFQSVRQIHIRIRDGPWFEVDTSLVRGEHCTPVSRQSWQPRAHGPPDRGG